MKINILSKFLIGLVTLVVVLAIVPSQVFAVAGRVYFHPTGDVDNGTQFTVEIRGDVPNPGPLFFGVGRGGGATIRVAYDPSKLQVVERNDTGGAFRPNNSQNWNGESAGIVRYESRILANAPGVDNKKIFSITFKAVAAGSTTLSFASANVNDGPTTGTASSFTIRNPVCPAGQVGTYPNCAPAPVQIPKPAPKPGSVATKTPTPSRAPVATPAPTPTVEETPAPTSDSDGGLSVENVKTSITRQKSTVTWSMNKPDIEPKLTYGLSKSNLKTEATIRKLSDGGFEATLSDIKPGTLYHFAIKAATADQLQAANYTGTFTSKGYPIQLTIKQNGFLAPGAKVKIGERTFTANKDAIITTELGDGTFEASVTPSGSNSAYSHPIVVKKVTIPQNGEPATQSFIIDITIKDEGASLGSSILPIILGVIGLAGIAGLIGFLLYRKKNQSDNESAIDSDLLASNYGSAMSDSRTQTPIPNLGAQLPTLTQPNLAPADQTIVENQTSYSDLATAPLNEPLYPPVDTTQQDIYTQAPPGNFALDQTTQVEPANDDTYQPLPPETQNIQQDEQLAQSVVAVESIENDVVNDTSTFEEAIYHPETGELDIIHKTNHTQAPTSSMPLAAQSESTQQNDVDITELTDGSTYDVSVPHYEASAELMNNTSARRAS